MKFLAGLVLVVVLVASVEGASNLHRKIYQPGAGAAATPGTAPVSPGAGAAHGAAPGAAPAGAAPGAAPVPGQNAAQPAAAGAAAALPVAGVAAQLGSSQVKHSRKHLCLALLKQPPTFKGFAYLDRGSHEHKFNPGVMTAPGVKIADMAAVVGALDEKDDISSISKLAQANPNVKFGLLSRVPYVVRPGTATAPNLRVYQYSGPPGNIVYRILPPNPNTDFVDPAGAAPSAAPAPPNLAPAPPKLAAAAGAAPVRANAAPAGAAPSGAPAAPAA